jgi:probable F420-dependent oxidoreductase
MDPIGTPDEVNRRRGPGIPSARNLDHAAFTVPDLGQAIRFFVEALGASLLYVEGPIQEGAWMRTNLNVDPAARCRVAMLRFGPTANVELFEYDAPDQLQAAPRNSDVGGHHLAIFVADIDRAYAYVRSLPGVTCQGVPKTITAGPLAGDRWVYFTTPWGMQLELISLPPSLPYERHTVERRYGPAPGRWATAHAPPAGPPRPRLGLGVALPVNQVRITGEELHRTVDGLAAAGCHSVWVNDHLAAFPPGAERYPYHPTGRIDWDPQAPQYEALSICAAVAVVTSRLEIGTAVLVLPQRHPVEVAKAAVTIADLSGGRFVLGVGAGWSRREMALLGWDPATRGRRLDEQIDVLRATWGAGPEPARPHCYPLPADAIFSPQPRPGQVPKILVGGVSPAALERVRQRGDGWLAVTGGGLAEVADAGRLLARLRATTPRPLRAIVKVRMGDADVEHVPAVVSQAVADGWDDVCFEFGSWRLDRVCALIDRCASELGARA